MFFLSCKPNNFLLLLLLLLTLSCPVSKEKIMPLFPISKRPNDFSLNQSFQNHCLLPPLLLSSCTHFHPETPNHFSQSCLNRGACLINPFKLRSQGFGCHLVQFQADKGELHLHNDHWVKSEKCPFAACAGMRDGVFERQMRRK